MDKNATDQTYIVSGKNGFLSKQVRYTTKLVGCVSVAVEHWFWVFVKMKSGRVVGSKEVSYKNGLKLINAD